VYYGKPLLLPIAALYQTPKINPAEDNQFVLKMKESDEPAILIVPSAGPHHKEQQEKYWEVQNKLVDEKLPEFRTGRKRSKANTNETDREKKFKSCSSSKEPK
jgi:TfoX/Sxy family transcriptional regulator of competence genes